MNGGRAAVAELPRIGGWCAEYVIDSDRYAGASTAREACGVGAYEWQLQCDLVARAGLVN